MDPRDFDAVAKALGATTSARRGALKLLVGAALGTSFGHATQEATTERKHKRRGGTGDKHATVTPEAASTQEATTERKHKRRGGTGDKHATVTPEAASTQEATTERKRKRHRTRTPTATPTPTRTPVPTATPGPGGGGTGGDRVLLALYDIHLPNAGVDWSTVVYRPRQFTNGLAIADPTRGTLKVDAANAYAGWDFLSTLNWSVHRVATAGNWLELQLNRAATLAVVWRGGPTVPRWLAGWTKGPDVSVAGTLFPTYRRRFQAGRVDLGAVY